MKHTLLAVAATSAAAVLTTAVSAQDADPTASKIEAALELPYRTEADRARDRNRRPVQALALMGLREDMRVFEFGPGNGWYTKILAPVLKDKGHLSIAYAEEWLADLDELMQAPQMEKVQRVNLAMGWDDELLAFEFDGMDFQASELDMFLNIREYHNLHGEERAEFNNAVFAALKPGGRYVVIDHTRRHMQNDTPENWRREDPVTVLIEVMEAGFELLEQSDMFYRLDDTLEYEVGRRTVAGNTDRFFFVFRKPD
ncbi:MAG: methyltransferase [Pseudomonadota bacterium]